MDKREEFIKRMKRLGINSHYGIMIPDKDILNPCATCMQNCNSCCHDWETELQIYQEALEAMTAERDRYENLYRSLSARIRKTYWELC